MTDLERLVLSAELLHGRRRVIQLPPQLHHFGLQFLYLTFTFYAPETQPRDTDESLPFISGSLHHQDTADCIMGLLINTLNVQ